MDIFTQALQTSELNQLLGDYDKNLVGYVYSMGFSDAFVLTNDAWKEKVAGIPHNSFLIAASFDPQNMSKISSFDKEIILLRVLEPSSLPSDTELLKARIEHKQRKTRPDVFVEASSDDFDVMTQAELQWGAIKCRILGTFYEDDTGSLRLGSDLENYMSSTRLKVYKPRGIALQKIINHINPEVLRKAKEEADKAGFKELPSPLKIGTVRYTSTDRLHRSKQEILVDVNIQPTDFLARRTAVLGMTRTGKSNTVKTTVSAVALSALKDNLNVGQIIFDINGEYANATSQDDDSSIASVFADSCVRYRSIETSGFKDLRTNFYRETTQALNLIQTLFRNDTSPFSGQDLDTFMASNLERPEQQDRSAFTRWKIRNAVFQCILYKADYRVPRDFTVEIPLSTNILSQIRDYDNANSCQTTVPNSTNVTVEEASIWFSTLRRINLNIKEQQRNQRNPTIGLASSTPGNSWIDPMMEAYLNMMERENSRGQNFGGYRAIVKYRTYHTDKGSNSVITDIVNYLHQGKIVILDLSVGPVEVRTVLSERIARQIFERSFQIFYDGKTPPNIVIYVEEAHNIIGKKEELTTTWPRIAKEGAKAKIALVYSTQEPSSIHPNILANTENWFVTHLNNDDELKTLGKFYDFADFQKSLKNAQDVGFARIKTLSSPFVIPTQIERFTPSELKTKIEKIKEKK